MLYLVIQRKSFVLSLRKKYMAKEAADTSESQEKSSAIEQALKEEIAGKPSKTKKTEKRPENSEKKVEKLPQAETKQETKPAVDQAEKTPEKSTETKTTPPKQEVTQPPAAPANAGEENRQQLDILQMHVKKMERAIMLDRIVLLISLALMAAVIGYVAFANLKSPPTGNVMAATPTAPVVTPTDNLQISIDNLQQDLDQQLNAFAVELKNIDDNIDNILGNALEKLKYQMQPVIPERIDAYASEVPAVVTEEMLSTESIAPEEIPTVIQEEVPMEVSEPVNTEDVAYEEAPPLMESQTTETQTEPQTAPAQ